MIKTRRPIPAIRSRRYPCPAGAARRLEKSPAEHGGDHVLRETLRLRALRQPAIAVRSACHPRQARQEVGPSARGRHQVAVYHLSNQHGRRHLRPGKHYHKHQDNQQASRV